MFRSRSWFGGGMWKPKNPHSLETLKYLYNVLSKNQTVSESNRGLLVESLRSIAEILIWGDQNDSSVFDFFLEKNMLSFFLNILKQRCGSYVCVQLLQTLNILFENIRNETSLYYLLSNNHVNSIIVHKFDFSDEEVMAYYISFLKTLSLKLNSHTIHFFYNEVSMNKETSKVFLYYEVVLVDSGRIHRENASIVRTTPGIFLETIVSTLVCFENDYTALFSLCLLYAIAINKGVGTELTQSILAPATDSASDKPSYNSSLVDKLIDIVTLSCQPGCRVRLVTLEVTILLLKKLVVRDQTSILSDAHLAAIVNAKEESTSLLRNFYKSEDIFLDMFQFEYDQIQKKPLNVEYLMMDSKMLLPPAGTPLTGNNPLTALTGNEIT
ncbi:protein CLEC16A-like [Diaphorina citri]|uniref:Protein CLEC16A-like n=1 Tax=Diaphorina citri TaxID=121845 RepID=A0A3Q0IWZ4_DIACI|nr:protein CLEC16A-like [Diaphorina citri]